MECLLSLSAESFVFQFSNQKYKVYYVQKCNFECCLCGCDTWLLTLREENGLRAFENSVLSRIFRPQRKEVRGEWRKVHNEELNYLYCSPNVICVIK